MRKKNEEIKKKENDDDDDEDGDDVVEEEEKRRWGLMRGNFCMYILHKPPTLVQEISPAQTVGSEIERKPILCKEEEKTRG